MVEFDYDPATQALTCTFAGSLDLSANAEVRPLLMEKLATAAGTPGAPLRIEFDLAAVTFVDSTFLRLCVHTSKAVPPGGFSIRNATPEVRKLFVLAGLDKVLVIG